jgi:hypothetical protein
VGQGAAAVAAVVAIGIGSAFVAGVDDRPEPAGRIAVDPSPTGEAADLGALFASGDTLYLDRGATRVRLSEVVQATYYSSAGVLLRTNETGASDGGAPFHFALVRPDQTVTTLALTLGEVVPSTDARLPYLAYARTDDGGGIQVVVHDLSTDQELASVDVPGLEWSGGWEAPPVSLDGDFVYVAGDEVTTVVNWRTGEVGTTDRVQPGWPLAGGRAMVKTGGTLEVVDIATGVALVRLTDFDAPWGSISPDGRWAMLYDQMTEDQFDVYDLERGTHVTIDGPPWDYGWTAGGDLYGVVGSALRECESGTGRCTEHALPDGTTLGDQVVLGGKTYES